MKQLADKVLMKTFSKFKLFVHYEGRELTEYVESESFIIGRSAKADLKIDTDNVSRTHLKVTYSDGHIFIEDLKSTNGTYVDGKMLEPNKRQEYLPDQKLFLGAKEDVKLEIFLRYTSENNNKKVKIIKDNLKAIFRNKEELDLSDVSLENAERQYKEVMNQVYVLRQQIIENAEKRADQMIGKTEFKLAELQKEIIIETDKLQKIKNEYDSFLKKIKEEGVAIEDFVKERTDTKIPHEAQEKANTLASVVNLKDGDLDLDQEYFQPPAEVVDVKISKKEVIKIQPEDDVSKIKNFKHLFIGSIPKLKIDRNNALFTLFVFLICLIGFGLMKSQKNKRSESEVTKIKTDSDQSLEFSSEE